MVCTDQLPWDSRLHYNKQGFSFMDDKTVDWMCQSISAHWVICYIVCCFWKHCLHYVLYPRSLTINFTLAAVFGHSYSFFITVIFHILSKDFITWGNLNAFKHYWKCLHGWLAFVDQIMKESCDFFVLHLHLVI